MKARNDAAYVGIAIGGLVIGAVIGQLLCAAGYTIERKPAAGTPLPTFQTATADPHGPLTHDNCLVRFNEARIAAGLPQASDDVGVLREYAQRHADDIAAGRTPLGHDEFDQWYAQGVFNLKSGLRVGEVVTGGDGLTCTKAVQNFLDSPTHKEIVLGATVQSVGVGTAEGVVVYIVSFK